MARMYLFADLIRINCHTGMSTLMRKKLLDEEGGLRKFGIYLAEDFFIAKCITDKKDKKWRIRISSQPALQNSGVCHVTAFQARLARWCLIKFLTVFKFLSTMGQLVSLQNLLHHKFCMAIVSFASHLTIATFFSDG